MAEAGHNSGGIAGDRLKSFIERIERLEEVKKAIGNDIKEVYAEAKSSGFDTKTIRQVVKLRKMDSAAREEQEMLLDLYKQAIGMLDGTPLGEAGARQAMEGRRGKGQQINAEIKETVQAIDRMLQSGDSLSITTADGSGVKIYDEGGERKAVLIGNVENEDDYHKAVDIVREHQNASTSFVQRHLGICHNRAARYLEHMQSLGIVSAPNHAGKRTVLQESA